MRYLCMAVEDEATLNALSQDEWHALRQETLEYVTSLRQSGRLIDAQPLQSVATAATVRVRGGKVSVVDGPFAETKEHIGGYFLVEAADMEEAIQIASKWPSARLGCVEVRPLEEGLRIERRYG